MTSLGFDLAKNEIRWCAIDGIRGAPNYVEHGIETYAVSDYRSELLTKSESIFLPLLRKFQPTAVAYRISLSASSADQIAYLHFPYAILITQCTGLEIPVFEFNTNSFTAKLLGFDRSMNKDEALESKVGAHSPHWNKVKSAAFSAWGALSV